MELYFVRVPLTGLPVHLVCYSNGKVALELQMPTNGLLDPATSEFEVAAWFDMEGYRMFNASDVEEYHWNEHIEYYDCPLLLKWLQQQKLKNPFQKGQS